MVKSIDMKYIFLLLATVIFMYSCHSEPDIPNIIFETDMGNDIDDAMALDLLYKGLDSRKINLLGISINKSGEAPAEYVDLMGTWYGYPEIPIGVVNGGIDCEGDSFNYARYVAELENEDRTPVFRCKGNEVYESVELYRRILSEMPDKSVTVVSVGFSTNIARLLESGPDSYSSMTGKQLVAKKVKLLCMMGGCFDDSNPCEYNIVKDIESAQKIFEEWPTEIVISPFEVGIKIEYPAKSILEDFTWTDRHPMVEAYKSYLPMPYDRPTWDLTAVLYSLEPAAGYFTVSPKGNVKVTEEGTTVFSENPEGNVSYLKVDETQAGRILDYFVSEMKRVPKVQVDHIR